MKTIDRRAVLRGGGVSLALPFLEAMRPRRARAQAAKRAKRFMAFFTPNGNVMSAWRPTGTETDFKLSRVLAPLEPHRKELIVLEGVDTMTSSPAACGHYPACITALTGQPTPSGNVYLGQGWSPGISVDQHIGNQIGKTTRFKSIELGVGVPKMKSGMDTLSYSGPNMPLPVQCNPADVFRRIFDELPAPGAPDPGASARARAESKTVLDAVLGQFRALGARVGAEDRRRLEAHAQQIREIETQLTATEGMVAAPGGTCRRPEAPASTTITGSFPGFPMVGKVQMDLAAMAFACDLTRVITLMWGNGTSSQQFTWVGVNTAHHGLSHARDAASIEGLTKINVWYMQQLAYLMDKLKQVPDGAGTMLDTAIIYSTNELTDGAAHNHNDAPLLLAGGAGGYFKMGRYLKYSGNTPHNNVLLSLVNAMGIPDTTFGKKEWCSGPLSRLTA